LAFKSNEPGVYVSAAVHAVVLAASLVAFSSAKKFEDVPEAIPVEMVTESELNQIVKGEKTAKPEDVKPRVDQTAPEPEQRPTPPIAEAQRDVPTPPPPLKRIPGPGDAEIPEPPKVAALPPPRPAPEPPRPPEPAPPAPPVRPTPPKPEAKPALTPEPPKPVANDAPEPPPPPQRPPQRQAEAKPETPEPPAPLPPRRPNIPPRVEEKPKPDQLAKLVETTRDVKPAPTPAARPRSGDENSQPATRYDPAAISKILASREPAQQRGSTAPAPVNRQSNLGSPTANAPKMSPNMSAQLNGLLIEQYKRCWTYIGTAQGREYQPQVSVSYSQSGGLVGRPVLRNPPSDPALKSLADSALRAVQRCNPLQIPAQYMPYYNEWKDLLLRFDPVEMMG